MAYQDSYRLSVHAVILDEQQNPLFVKTTYGAKTWTLPGGAIDPGETIHEALSRECREELGCEVTIRYLSGVYFHQDHHSHAFVFRCEMSPGAQIRLSSEHSEFRHIPVEELKDSHRRKIEDCLSYQGRTASAKF